ncbi:hypothetical protein N657DRAFT_373716 [Parathielavia appendiculata]|uniref:Uncharacterized protein n=1 Tax=Parathielavia appendiculata TaxID=2587402 RepID=A0AAN6TPR9_9PEZI|nr:hypothetical protein N657DRAFT_373716 [Parathielavia appendiculata]
MVCVLVTGYLWCLGALCLSFFTFGSPLHPARVWLLFCIDIFLRAGTFNLCLGLGALFLGLSVSIIIRSGCYYPLAALDHLSRVVLLFRHCGSRRQKATRLSPSLPLGDTPHTSLIAASVAIGVPALLFLYLGLFPLIKELPDTDLSMRELDQAATLAGGGIAAPVNTWQLHRAAAFRSRTGYKRLSRETRDSHLASLV